MSNILIPEQVEAIRDRLGHRGAEVERLRAEADLATRPGQYVRLLSGAQRWDDDLGLVAALLAAYDALTAEVERLRESAEAARHITRMEEARAEAAERKAAEAAEQRDAMFDRLNAVLYLAQNPDGRIRRRTFVWADRITRWAPPNRALDGEAD